jgi:hypothetical protein
MGDLIQVCVCVWGNVLRTVSYVVSLRYGQIICSYCGGTQLASKQPCSGPCGRVHDQKFLFDVMRTRSGWTLWGEPRLGDFAILGCKGVAIFGLADFPSPPTPSKKFWLARRLEAGSRSFLRHETRLTSF